MREAHDSQSESLSSSQAYCLVLPGDVTRLVHQDTIQIKASDAVVGDGKDFRNIQFMSQIYGLHDIVRFDMMMLAG